MSKVYYNKTNTPTVDLTSLKEIKTSEKTKHKKNNNPAQNKYHRILVESSQRRTPLPATIEEIKESRSKQNELDFMKLYFEKNIEEDFSFERYKVEREIFALENKFGKTAVRNFVQKALSDFDEIFKTHTDKAFSVARDARFLACSQTISQLFDYENSGIKKIMGEGKYDISKVLNKLNKIEDGIFT